MSQSSNHHTHHNTTKSPQHYQITTTLPNHHNTTKSPQYYQITTTLPNHHNTTKSPQHYQITTTLPNHTKRTKSQHNKKGWGVRGNLGFPQKDGACGETLVSRNYTKSITPSGLYFSKNFCKASLSNSPLSIKGSA
jgi:hypothetical protein